MEIDLGKKNEIIARLKIVGEDNELLLEKQNGIVERIRHSNENQCDKIGHLERNLIKLTSESEALIKVEENIKQNLSFVYLS